jgi:hypothetical protein
MEVEHQSRLFSGLPEVTVVGRVIRRRSAPVG